MKKIYVALLLTCLVGIGVVSASEQEYGSGHMMDDYGSMPHGYGMMDDRAMMGRGPGCGGCPPMMGGGMMHHGWRQDDMPMMGRGYMGPCGMMMGDAIMGLTGEQQHKLLDDTVKLRKEMHMLHFEYKEAVRNPKTTLEELGKIEQEMLDLRMEMMKKIDSLRAKN